MPITDKYLRVPVGDIKVLRDERQRREIDVSDLLPSVTKLGVLQPIIVTHEFVLVAGERRLEASKQAAKADIPVRFADELSPTEAQIIELEENIKRKDLPWQDLVSSLQRIHTLYLTLDSDWTMGETANAVSLTIGIVSMYLKVAGHMDEERVQKADTVREAYNMLGRRDARAAGNALQELIETVNEISPRDDEPMLEVVSPGGVLPQAKVIPLAPPQIIPAERSILQESFLSWAPGYTGKKFNFIHCDFPYGVQVFNGPQSGAGHSDTYDDSPEVYFQLIETLCQNLDKLLMLSGHVMFWYSDKHRERTLDMFAKLAPSLKFWPYPLIWAKSDNAGIAQDVKRGPRHVYETCLFASRGNRQIVKVVSDFYSAPTDKRFHVSTKPEPMLKHFMSMLVDENTSMLDPTCGSASSLRAAEELGAARVLGMDIDHQCVEVARMALKNARTLRVANRVAGA